MKTLKEAAADLNDAFQRWTDAQVELGPLSAFVTFEYPEGNLRALALDKYGKQDAWTLLVALPEEKDNTWRAWTALSSQGFDFRFAAVEALPALTVEITNLRASKIQQATRAAKKVRDLL